MDINTAIQIINLIFSILIPIIIKILKDIYNLYIELKSYSIEHKTKIESLENDIKELKKCLYELKKDVWARK